MAYHVSADEFERIAADALESIPPALRAQMDADNLMITIQTDATADDRGSGIDERVLGYFQGSTEFDVQPGGVPQADRIAAAPHRTVVQNTL